MCAQDAQRPHGESGERILAGRAAVTVVSAAVVMGGAAAAVVGFVAGHRQ